MWQDRHDANMRLSNCVLMHNNEGFYVADICLTKNGIGVAGFYLKDISKADREQVIISLQDKGWDWKGVKAGYINRNKSCCYVERIPVRKWKHGLHTSNIMVSGRGFPREVIYTPEFGDCVKGLYPSHADCLKKMKANKTLRGYAFSRHYALTKGELDLIWLMYRGEKVGWVEGNDSVLSEEYFYLHEDLTEAKA